MKKAKRNEFDAFFFEYSDKQKEKLLTKVVKKANKEQLAVVKQYKKSLKTAH